MGTVILRLGSLERIIQDNLDANLNKFEKWPGLHKGMTFHVLKQTMVLSLDQILCIHLGPWKNLFCHYEVFSDELLTPGFNWDVVIQQHIKSVEYCYTSKSKVYHTINCITNSFYFSDKFPRFEWASHSIMNSRDYLRTQTMRLCSEHQSHPKMSTLIHTKFKLWWAEWLKLALHEVLLI